MPRERLRLRAQPRIAAMRRQFSGFHRWSLYEIFDHLIPAGAFDRLRLALARASGMAVGDGTCLGGRLTVTGGTRPASRVSIGRSCFVNDGCRFDASDVIRIGSNVYFAHDVALITSSHEIAGSRQRAGIGTAAPVVVGDGVWVGARSVILPGVTVGNGSIVAAGAVVTSDVPPDTLVAGVPARLIRSL